MWSNVQTDATTATIAAQAINTGASASRASWWCSNGLYNFVTSSGNQTQNTTQTLPDNANQRYELALVGCPQLSYVCKVALANTDAAASGSNVLVILIATADMTAKDKCTWVAYGVTNPPSFKMEAGTAGSATAGMSTNAASSWNIHHMEYNND